MTLKGYRRNTVVFFYFRSYPQLYFYIFCNTYLLSSFSKSTDLQKGLPYFYDSPLNIKILVVRNEGLEDLEVSTFGE